MDYESFIAFAERSKKLWQDFKDSFQEPELKAYLKNSYAVLSHLSGQLYLGSTDFRTIAMESPSFLVSNQARESLIKHVKELEALKKDSEERSKKDRARIEKWFEEFDPKRLKFEEPRLEVRFPSLKMDFIQRIKRSPLVDHERIGKERVCIRVVLLTK